MQHASRFCLLVWLCVSLTSCSDLPYIPLSATATPSVIPTPKPTRVPTKTPAVATATPIAAVGSSDTPLRIRIIQSDLNSEAALQSVLQAAAERASVHVVIDVHTADGVYALAQTPDVGPRVDVWIGTEFDVAQLASFNAVATGVVTPDATAYPYVADAIATHPQLAVYPFAAKNYLIGIANSELLPALPTSTADLMTVDRRTLGRTRYDMAYAWAEGRWFDAFIAVLDPESTQPSAIRAPTEDALMQGLTSLKEMRTLGPREATSYQESITDFVNWRVQFTLDGDAAIRRYSQYSQTLNLAFAAPPVYTIAAQPLNPPIDVVSLILAAGHAPDIDGPIQQIVASLREANAQTTLVTRLHWVPYRADVYQLVDITETTDAAVLMQLAATFRVQRYSATTICRWDAYESVLPFVLLREIRLEEGVRTLHSAIEACYAP